MLKKQLLLLGEASMLPAASLRANGWEVVQADSLQKARRLLSNSSFDLAACQLDLKSDTLSKDILEICMVNGLSALVICPSEKMDLLTYQYRKAPIMILPYQTPRHVFVQVLDYLGKEAENKRYLQDSLSREKRKLQDEKLVAQAKLQLVSLCRWSEERAHQYVLKTAMDHSLTKGAAARLVLRKLEGLVHERQKNQCNAVS